MSSADPAQSPARADVVHRPSAEASVAESVDMLAHIWTARALDAALLEKATILIVDSLWVLAPTEPIEARKRP
jgi:hypothetical protein